MGIDGRERPANKRKHWTAQEDEAITALIGALGSLDWSAIARLLVQELGLRGRTSKQCRERWHNHLDPSLKKAKWTNEELLLLFTAQ